MVVRHPRLNILNQAQKLIKSAPKPTYVGEGRRIVRLQAIIQAGQASVRIAAVAAEHSQELLVELVAAEVLAAEAEQ